MKPGAGVYSLVGFEVKGGKAAAFRCLNALKLSRIAPSSLAPPPLAAATSGATLQELLRELDGRYAGFRFRIIDEQDSIRPHIKIFVNRVQAPTLAQGLRPSDEVLVVAALSGG